MEETGKTFYYYSTAFRQKVISEIESGRLSIEQARKIYNIGGSSTITKWIKKYGKNHLLGKRVRIEMEYEIDQIKKLEKEKTELESALAKAHVKILSLETIIESAEEDLGIDLKKSVDKRQSIKQSKEGKADQ